jgi:hypothetical protein
VLRQDLEERRGWSESQLVRTKSACGAVDVPVWNEKLKRVYPECAIWRNSVLRELEAGLPPSSSGFLTHATKPELSRVPSRPRPRGS